MADDVPIGAKKLWGNGLPPKSVSAFLFSATCIIAATLIRLALGHIAFESSAFAPYYAATLIVSLLCGWRAASAGAIAGGLGAFALFIWPEIGAVGTKATAIISLCLYGASSTVIILAAESHRKLLVQVRAQERYRRLLSDEMAHRIKNTLAIAQTIVWHSMPHDSVVRDKLCSRLSALGKTNERLLYARGPILLSALLRSELEHFETSRVTMSGPDVPCSENAIVCLSLIFHELATNAAKYGALAAPNGRISVAWSISKGQLCIEWREEGVFDLRVPDRKGFGSKLLQSASAQFRGRVQQLFESDGLRCRLWLELARLERVAAASDESMPPEKNADRSLSGTAV
jgi:two-component sensor histidine kinase